MDRMLFAIEPLVEEIQALEKREQELKEQIAILKNQKIDPLEKHATFEHAANTVRFAQRKIGSAKVKEVLGGRKLSKIKKKEYAAIIRTLKQLVEKAPRN